MRLYGFVFLIVSIEAKHRTKYCDVVSTDPTKHCYVKEILTSIAHSPNQLSVDRTSNTLYFSFDFGQGEYVPAILNIESKNISVLKGVKDAFAIANDPTTGEMYFGGSHGIYKYNAPNRSLQRLNINNLDIWWLFVKKRIYFIKFPSLSAFYYENKTIRSVPELKKDIVHQFVMDKEDNIFFINGTGLFGIKHDDNKPVLLRDHPRFLGIATDMNGYVHVCSEDGIFIVTKVIQKVKKVINVQGVLGITFDSANNIIYSDSHEIIRLVPMARDNYYDQHDHRYDKD
ncbi:ommochrome-binding protein-like [Helicoverpa zea]|uniref:ommochrome-binding protein-like n=1 Tax=Helicoverpa zea TaxID=7113 RepID=UPI001F566832|nr:ommochrome-binding protein-like [Helicoverpa zea]